ncbi:SSB, partial [Symbiodinium sp. CCMP2592]
MQSYFRGEWRPAWLRQYGQDKAKRDVARQLHDETSSDSHSSPTWESLTGPEQQPASSSVTPSTASSAGTNVVAEVTNLTPELYTPVENMETQGNGWTQEQWDEWHAWDGWTTTATSTGGVTTSSTTWPIVVPNAGLFPEVRPAPPPGNMSMSMTGAERQRLSEQGVPRREVQRIADLLESMDRHQTAGTGPESRWALGCHIQRASEAIDALETITEILARRVVPRGYLPVRRVPAREDLRWRIFHWSRQGIDAYLNTASIHLNTPLQPGETEAQGSDVVVPSTPEDVVPTTPAGEEDDENVADSSGHHGGDPALSGGVDGQAVEHMSDGGPSMNSTWALNSQGDMIEILPADLPPGAQPRGPPPPQPVRYDPPSSSASSSSESSTRAPRRNLAPLSPQGIWRSPPPDDDEDTGLVQLSMGGDLQTLMTLASSTTTTSTSSSVSPENNVRDAVAAQLVQGNMVDSIDVMRRIMDRQRHLRHCDRLLAVALEEALQWIRLPIHAVPYNARSMELEIWRMVTEQAQHHSSISAPSAVMPAIDPAFLLQPDLPTSLDELHQAFLPNEGAHTVAGFRRRGWRQHVRLLYQASGRNVPEGHWPSEDDRRLLLLQNREDVEVGNWPVDDLDAVDAVVDISLVVQCKVDDIAG